MIFNSIGEALNKRKRNKLLDDKIEIRINCTEKILFEKYAKVCGLEVEDLMKKLVRKEIDEFVKG